MALSVGARGGDGTYSNYGSALSGWWLLWNNWLNPFAETVKAPSMSDISSALMW